MSERVVELAETIGAKLVELTSTDNDSGGNKPGDRFVYWVTSSPAITEGDSFTLQAEMSSADEYERACVVAPTSATTTAAGDFGFSPVEVVFAPGETQATVELTTTGDAANNSSTLIELEFDTKASLKLNPNAFPLQTSAKYGADKVQISVEDEAISGSPEFYIAGAPAQTFEEGSGARELFVVMDEPAVDDVTINVASAPGTVSSSDPNPLYLAINQNIVIPSGARRSDAFIVTILDDDTVATGPQNFTITASLVSGTATARAGFDVLTVSISDNDAGFGVPRVEFQTSSQVVQEGTSITVVARVVNVFGDPVVFDSPQTVPVTSTTTGTAGVDYIENWGTQTPGLLSFAAGESEASFDVQVVDDGSQQDDDAESVTYTINSVVGADWVPGTANPITLTFGQDGPEITELLLPAATGSSTTRRVIQGVCAIVPPSTTLPSYAIDKGDNPGEKVQLVGLKRNAANEWISARFYAMHGDEESIPRTASSLRLRVATDNDVDPPEAGSFPEFPKVRGTLIPSNMGLAFYRIRINDPFGSGFNYGTVVEDWMSPTGKFQSTGPNLCEEEVWMVRGSQLAGPAPPWQSQSGSGDFCAIVQIGMKRFAGDNDVIMASGRLLNGAWRKGEDPFAENVECDGELYFESFKIQTLERNGVTFTPYLPVTHPGQSNVDANNIELLPARGSSYFMRNCAQYQFHMAFVRDTATSEAYDRATDYWKCKHAAWAVGPLGSTHQRIYGEACEETIDYGRPEVGFADGSQSGWLGIKAIGDYQGDGDGGATYDGIVNIWQSGAQAPYTVESGSYDGTRQGWWQPSGTPGTATEGNDGIHGQLATVPYWGFWLRQRCAMSGTFARTRVSYRDVETGAAPYWWELAYIPSVSIYQVPILGGLEDRSGSQRHWHFNTSENTSSYELWDTPDLSQYRLAPTTRPWNVPGTGEDPARALMDLYPSEDPTHWGRVRNELSDCWEVLGEWMAFACWEELAAFYSRTQSPVEVLFGTTSGSPNRQDQAFYNSWDINRSMASTPGFKNLGYLRSSNTGFAGNTISTSAVAWMLDILGGFIQVAPQSIREEFIGRGPVTSSIGGQNVSLQLKTMLGNVSMPSGFLFRSTSPAITPNPYLGTDDDPNNSAAFEPTNLTLRTGALPWESSSDPTESAAGAAYQLFYHHLFYIKGLTAWVIATEADLSSLPGWVLETYRSHDNYRKGAKVFSDAGGSLVQSNYPIVAQGPKVSGTTVDADDLRLHTLTEDRMRAGEAKWQVIKPNATPPGTEDISSHQSKSGISGSLGAIYAGDPSIATLTQDVFKQQDASQQAFIFYCMGSSNKQSGGVSFAFNIANLSGGRRRTLVGEHTWMAGYIAYLQNLIS